MDILDGFQKLVSTDGEILISIDLDCRSTVETPRLIFLRKSLTFWDKNEMF